MHTFIVLHRTAFSNFLDCKLCLNMTMYVSLCMCCLWDDWAAEELLTDYLHVEHAAIDWRVTDDLGPVDGDVFVVL